MSSQYGHHPCSSSLEGTEEVRLRTLWSAAEAWPCVAGLEFPWRGPERTLREVADEASVTVETPGHWRGQGLGAHRGELQL